MSRLLLDSLEVLIQVDEVSLTQVFILVSLGYPSLPDTGQSSHLLYKFGSLVQCANRAVVQSYPMPLPGYSFWVGGNININTPPYCGF